jgi:glucose uptake protein GlcU
MPSPISQLQQKLLMMVCGVIALALILISVLLVATQFSEVSSRNEMLSLTSFIVILTFSGIAFNWCRVPPNFASEEILKKVYRTGIHLFLSSLLALVASFFTWFQTTPEMNTPWMAKTCLLLHWIFISLAVIFFLISMLRLLVVIINEHADMK